MNLLKKLLQLFTRECDHRFKSDEVYDCNMDPKCVRCGANFEVINRREITKHNRFFQFEVDTKSIGLHKLKRA